MRKRNLKFFFDTFFWYIIYFLPVICYLFYLLFSNNIAATGLSFLNFVENVGFGIMTDNVVITSLKSIFGSSGILPFFNSDLIFVCLGWFICTLIIHLLVDFLLFIPRLAHKWLEKATQGD